MSNARFSILQAKAVKDKSVSDAQFRTLAALGMYADQDGWCYPSLQTLGDDLGKSKQAVGRDTIALRKLGYLEVTARFTKEGSRRSSMYRLIFDIPRQRDVDTPSTSLVDTPSTSDVDVNDPIERTQKRGDILDAEINYHLKPKAIKDAFSKHFKLTPNWEAKYNRQFMEWAIENYMTPEQVEKAADVWRKDRRFNWKIPDLRGVQEHWLELIDTPIGDGIKRNEHGIPEHLLAY